MYTDVPPGSDTDALHHSLFRGAIGYLKSFPEMPAIVAFTKTFLEERLTPFEPVRIHEMEGDLAERCAALKREYANNREVKELWQNLFEAVGLNP